MAAHGDSSVKEGKNSIPFTSLLASAASEWFLIFLLFIDAGFSFLLTKFARYCKLQTPCVFCSRLDRILEGQKPDFYRNLLCKWHRLEISSLLSCQIHDNIADGRAMCDDCVLSSNVKNKPDPDMHRLLPGIMGYGLKSPDLSPSTTLKLCSCCHRPWRTRNNVQKMLKLRPPLEASRKPPLPRRSSSNSSLKKAKIKVVDKPRNHGYHQISDLGYTELKVQSDEDSELRVSNEDAMKEANWGYDFESSPEVSRVEPSETPSSRKVDDNSVKEPEEDATRLRVDGKSHSSSLPELISLDDVAVALGQSDVPDGGHVTHDKNASLLSELIDLVEPTLSSDRAHLSSKASPDSANIKDLDNNTIKKVEGIISRYCAKCRAELSNGTASDPLGEASSVTQCDQSQAMEESMERETSMLVSEQHRNEGINFVNATDSDSSSKLTLNEASDNINVGRVKDPWKAETSSEQTSNEAGSSIKFNSGALLTQRDGFKSDGDMDFKHSDAFESHHGSPDRAGSESNDGTSVSEVEGESLVDRLRRQIEYDKKCLGSLHKELEEERNAAAIAANQAMAMITRLQEEKAALHMEASQFVRMMEEQAEHDVDALDRANDLLAEKDKEIQDLEAELEYYTSILSDGRWNSPVSTPKKSARLARISGSPSAEVKEKSLLGFEGEKLYILERLRSLEKELSKISHGEADKSPENGRKKGVFLDDSHPSTETIPIISNGGNHPMVCADNADSSLVRVKKEISDLHEQLEALESDHKLIELISNSLVKGRDGLVFIQEVAHQLKEIRKSGMRRRNQPNKQSVIYHEA